MRDLPFEKVAKMFDPLIKSRLKVLGLTGERFEMFYQAGLIGLWKAWSEFDETKGSFPSLANLRISGGIMDELRKESNREKRIMPMVPEIYENILSKAVYDTIPLLEKEAIAYYLEKLTKLEQRWVVERICNQKREVDIAAEYGVSVGAVKSWRKRVVKKLRTLR
ncbi:sigma-70 family RNA polymerase sigma factor [Fictibacillus aquaticus]|uniref:RNA polymerase sigma-70 region 2 domain-containing protein n=1 Tax=Fictibacillus aquaticus TaxID=2021314 RepID=A0A235F8J0_9BACL|nr:sigma-70 family RNA polymerase sigma factor [Fictibacillus aquaticus]OYD57671.1 hypothetical protein CGZ90_13480 [Fictibacillus aquaticus]